MKKFGLLPKLVIGIIIGVVAGSFLPKPFIEVLATFNGIFGNFLNFSIPLIISCILTTLPVQYHATNESLPHKSVCTQPPSHRRA